MANKETNKEAAKGRATLEPEAGRERRISKKNQIISLFTSGLGSVEEIALITASRASYVASVLQEAGLITGYFDLYTTSGQRMNVHSRFFAGKLGFRDEETAQQSIDLINRYYHQFAVAGDRAGQHHALMMALTMFNRARWTRKLREAEIFRQWLLKRLNGPEIYFEPEPQLVPQEPTASMGTPRENTASTPNETPLPTAAPATDWLE